MKGFVCTLEIAQGSEQFVWLECGNTERYIFDNECDWLPFSFYHPKLRDEMTRVDWRYIPYAFTPLT